MTEYADALADGGVVDAPDTIELTREEITRRYLYLTMQGLTIEHYEKAKHCPEFAGHLWRLRRLLFTKDMALHRQIPQSGLSMPGEIPRGASVQDPGTDRGSDQGPVRDGHQ